MDKYYVKMRMTGETRAVPVAADSFEEAAEIARNLFDKDTPPSCRVDRKYYRVIQAPNGEVWEMEVVY